MLIHIIYHIIYLCTLYHITFHYVILLYYITLSSLILAELTKLSLGFHGGNGTPRVHPKMITLESVLAANKMVPKSLEGAILNVNLTLTLIVLAKQLALRKFVSDLVDVKWFVLS